MKRISLILFCIVLLFKSLHPTIKGSETALSIEPFYTFPASDNDNTMLGFGWFKNGFSLQDATTSCTFNSVFPVSGNISLNGGKLYLNQDFSLKNLSTFITPGSIFGNNYLFDLNSSLTFLGGSVCDQVFNNAQIRVGADLLITGTVRFEGDCFFCGCGKRILFDDHGCFIIGENAAVTFKNVTFCGVSSDKFFCADDSGRIIFGNVSIILSGDYSFSAGSVMVTDNVTVFATDTFSYHSARTSTIHSNSELIFKGGGTISLERNGNVEPLYAEDDSSVLRLDTCTLTAGKNGVTLTRGTLLCDHEVHIDINSTGSEDGIILGDGTAAGDLHLIIEAGTAILFEDGDLVYNMSRPDLLISHGAGARLIRYGGTNFFINQNLLLYDMHVIDKNYGAAMIVADGKTVNYRNVTFEWPWVVTEMTANRENYYTNVLSGNQEVSLIKGILPCYLMIKNSGNFIHGVGGLSGQVVLFDENAEVQFKLQGPLIENVILNEGLVTLLGDLAFSQDCRFDGSGTVNLAGNSLQFGPSDQIWSGGIDWNATDGSIALNSNVSLSGAWTFNGKCILDGHGHPLTLTNDGEIIVAPGATLVLKNILIDGVHGDNIRCDDSGKIVFENTSMLLDGDYSFTTGSFSVYDNLVISGEHAYLYHSSKTSTIHSNSELHVKNGVTFSIERNGSVEPLYSEDESSLLHLDNCTLGAGVEGASITRGTLLCDHDVHIDVDSTGSADGIILGDGTEFGDLNLIIEAGAAIHFVDGNLVYNMSRPDLFTARGGGSRMIRYGGTTFYVNQNLFLSNMNVIDENFTAAMIVADGKTVSYNNVTFEWPGVAIDMTANRANYYTNVLAGNQQLTLLKGILPSYMLIMNKGNLIDGVGGLSGQVILWDSNAEVQFKLQGPLIENVILNGGLVTILRDLELSQCYGFEGSGKIDLSRNCIFFGPCDQSWDGGIDWSAMAGKIVLNSKVSLSGTWTFNGLCGIDGNGQTLVLENGGEIVVASGSTLNLKNLRIEGVHGNNIRCADSTAHLSLGDLVLLQDGAYCFTTGAMEVRGNLTLKGDTVFSYQSAQTSTIYSNAKLVVDRGMTFSFDPIWNESYSDDVAWEAAKDLLVFEDNTSAFKLNGATLHVTTTGMRLKNGLLLIKDKSNFVSELDGLFHMEEGIIIGTGDSSSDMICEIAVGSMLNIGAGTLSYKNINSTSWNMLSDRSVINVGEGSKLKLHQSLDVGKGSVVFHEGSVLARASECTLVGALHMLGSVYYELCYN